MKYSNDVVENIVARLMSGEVSQHELARVVGIPRGTIRRWLRNALKRHVCGVRIFRF